MELDLSEAIEEGALVLSVRYGVGFIGRKAIGDLVEAAAPIIERQVRENIAQQIETLKPSDRDLSNNANIRYNALNYAAKIARGEAKTEAGHG